MTYDTGALIAAERNDRRMWAWHRKLIEHDVVPVVPAPVLAEAWRGGSRQASLARLLETCEIEPMTEPVARSVGVAMGRARHDDVVDAAVVECAVRRGTGIVTSDEVELRRVARSLGADLHVERP